MPFILAAKELNGGIYITRLPKAIVNPDGSVQPGIPDNWYFVGSGHEPERPRVQRYAVRSDVHLSDALERAHRGHFNMASD